MQSSQICKGVAMQCASVTACMHNTDGMTLERGLLLQSPPPPPPQHRHADVLTHLQHGRLTLLELFSSCSSFLSCARSAANDPFLFSAS